MEQSYEGDPASLETLAKSRFGALREAERRLLQNAPRGELVDCSIKGKDLNAPENNPEHAHQWGPDREIRASLLRWVCLDPTARAYVAPDGFRIEAVRLDTRLELSFAAVPFPIAMFDCWLPEGISLVGAELPALFLVRSRIGRARSADSKTAKAAILADGLRLRGPLVLTSTRVVGEVRLFTANVDAALECDGALFENPGAVAVDCELAKVGSVHLRNSFRAEGEVRLRGAEIHGNLDCQGGLFRDQRVGTVVLTLEGAKIDGSVFLRQGFRATGAVVLLGAEIEGDLDLREADFSTAPEGGLNGSRANIKGSLFMSRARVGVDTWITLESTVCAILDDDLTSWPGNAHLLLDGFVYHRLEVPGDPKARLAWLRCQLPNERSKRYGQFRPQPYRQLAQVLRAQGHEAEARDVLIGMALDRRKYARLSWSSWFSSLVLWHVIRNGYKPLRAAGWLLVLWLTNALIFGAAYDNGLMGPTDRQAFEAFAASQGSVPAWYSPFRATSFGIDVSLPIINLGERDKWRPLTKPVNGNPSVPTWLPAALSVWRWVAIVAGWFLASMLVAGVAGLVAKQ